MKFHIAALATCLLGLSACDVLSAAADTPVPPTPAPIKRIVAARGFTIETPFPYTWTKEHIMVHLCHHSISLCMGASCGISSGCKLTDTPRFGGLPQ